GPDELDRARREALTRVQRLSPGEWDAAAALRPDSHHRGFLIVDGLLSRTVDVLGRRCVELVGPGDVMGPWPWGGEGSHVRADGIVVPLPLGHQRLADLTGAHRASVTTAMGELRRTGAVSRRDSGEWVLHGEPPEQLRHHKLVAALT